MKKLIIVCEEKCRKYGDYLAQLISMEDDTEENIVGTKDGEAAAQVWLEKDNSANSAQISSNQYIVFIGQDQLMKNKSAHMKVEFSGFGVKYGWLGKQAFLCVDNIVSVDEYDDFIKFAKQYQRNIEALFEPEENTDNKDKETKNDANPINNMFALFSQIVDFGASIGKWFQQMSLNDKIEEQQYSCAVMKFYLDDLSKFLGL
ncbi:MAG: hypothetical protein ACI4XI_08695 [Ruminococcus sp.]